MAKKKKPVLQKPGPYQKATDALVHFGGLMKTHGIAEFEWEDQGTRIKLKTQAAQGPVALPSAPVSAVPQASATATPTPSANPRHQAITSPFVGTFYRSASPSAGPYVKEGQRVKKGDVLCIVEAMKLMNEIEAEVSGTIIKALVENGQPVEFGESLFMIDPS